MNKDVYRLLAGKGEGNDSELAFVDGKLSHVTIDEKNMIEEKGKLGELITALFGSGKINKNTGLPGFHTIEKSWWGDKELTGDDNEHNQKHSSGWPPSHPPEWGGEPSTEQKIEGKEESIKARGDGYLADKGTIGEMGGDIGQEALTAEQYQNMTPEQIVDDIFQKQYNGIAPPGTTTAAFKKQLAGRLRNMPQFKGIFDKEEGFLKTRFKEDVYGISKDAGKAGAQMAGAYGSGMGSQLRTAYGGMKDVSQQFAFAEQGYAEDIYGLEQKKGAEWERDYTSFLGTLPSAA